MEKKLKELLLQQGVITKEQLLLCLKHQKARNSQFTEALIATGVISGEEVIVNFLAKQLETGNLTLKELDLDQKVVEIIPPDIAQKYNIIAVQKTQKVLTVAISDPRNLFVVDAVKFLTGCTVKPVVAPEEDIKNAIKLYYEDEGDVDGILDDIKDTDFEVLESESDEEPDDISTAVSDAPVVKLVNHLIVESVRKGASDIHIESYEKVFRVRYRIDGKLIEVSNLPYRLRPAIISRIKIMSDLDISERRMPQDGRIKIKIGMNTVDIRVSTIPTIYGEKVVMRILDASNLVLDLDKLGLPSQGLSHVKETLQSPFGMMLVTGPTGSGKTTTLYSALSLLNKPPVNIMTAEDPVEYNIDGINQVNVNSDIGLTFAAALRSFLRQDPDIVMVGEIRDLETIEIAIKAALTGHLVFSTLHTNNSVATIARMLDMGVEPFLVSSSVRTIIAQRLIRKVCSNCMAPAADRTAELTGALGIPAEEASQFTLFEGKGCALCNDTGYAGRVGLYEVLPISPAIQEMIIHRATPNELRAQALEEGMVTLRKSAIEKLRTGATTVEEVITLTSEG